jgi:predicted alpha/beta superfamily hydrolase
MKTLTGARLALFVLVAAAASSSAGTAQQSDTGTAAPVTLANTYEYILRSKVNGRRYRIEVALPSAYVSARPEDLTRYPTLYLLDGVTDFPLLFAHMQFDAMVAPTRTILVGVSAADSFWVKRSADYTPPLTSADAEYFKGKPFPPPQLGGAPQFLRVLKEEVIPFMDSSYRTSDDRAIEGASLGGLFVAYAMLEEPDLFTRYAMISPSLWYPWGRKEGIILAREPDFAKQHPTFPKTVYLSVGSDEGPDMIAAAWQFVRQLCTSISKGYYKNLDLGAETLAGQPHGSPTARVRALAALYPPDSTRIKLGRRVTQDCR